MSLRKSFFYRYSTETFLFLAAFFIRFPFFFRDYVDKDESTFILMGQSIADGHLPYDYLWDLKPPLLFYLFALIEKVFPHSFFAIRFFGMIIIFLSSLLLIKIARVSNLKNGFWIALGYVVLSSEFGSLQGVMSEHFAVFFLLLGLFFFFRKTGKIDFLLSGIAFGCAIFCKLNYAYAITALLIFYLLNNYKKESIKQCIYELFIVMAGILLPVILIAIPFIVAGKTSLFINSVFLAPLQYARALNFTWIDKLKTTWWVSAITLLVAYLSIKYSQEKNRPVVLACIAILAGTVYTFFSSGIVNGHYLVQVYPFFLVLLFGIIIQKKIRLKLSVAAVVVILLSFESILETGRLLKSVQNPAEYRPGFEVISELKKRKLDDSKIFFADYHISYWLLNQYPLTKSTTHPSNLARPYLFPYYGNSNKTSLEELKYILEGMKPEVIVSESNGLHFFSDSSVENLYFRKIVNSSFEKIYEDTTDHIFIWERKEK